MESGLVSLLATGMGRMMSGSPLPPSADTVTLHFGCNTCTVECQVAGETQYLKVATDGTQAQNTLAGTPSLALCSGYWEQENVFKITLRMLETCNERYITFTFGKDGSAQALLNSNHIFVQKGETVHLTKI